MNPERILELAEQKLSQRAIAERLGTSKSTVARVLSEKAGSSDGTKGRVVALS